MRQSQLFIKTRKETPKDEVSKNAILLTRAGFIHKEMAGVYTFLPLGLKVLNNIENIIRRHMDNIGRELLMSALSPVEKWKDTGRLSTVDVLMKTSGANDVSKAKSTNEYILNSTHEEMITPIVAEYIRSYKELPVAFYQIQTKFRNEARAKSGLLRGREFRMKDLYSFHKDEADLKKYYEEAQKVYMDVFNEIGIGSDTFMTLASGGDFTKEYSHEFQTLTETGEDLIYLDRKNKIAYNKEIVNEETEKKLGVKFSDMEQVMASEVGNIFPLNVKFSEALDYTYTNEEGKQLPVYMGCYGMGPSRIMGVIVEKFADEKGLIWPESIAPFSLHLISLAKNDDTKKEAETLYTKLKNHGVEVLFDDREVSAGEKFNDSDLIGIPMRVVISDKSLSVGGVEVKERKGDKVDIMGIEEFLKAWSNGGKCSCC